MPPSTDGREDLPGVELRAAERVRDEQEAEGEREEEHTPRLPLPVTRRRAVASGFGLR